MDKREKRDPAKEKETAKHLPRIHHTLPVEVLSSAHEEFNIEPVQLFVTNFSKARKIVFLLGAGISVAAGIKSFRGDAGIYTQLDGDKIRQLFTADYVDDKDNPVEGDNTHFFEHFLFMCKMHEECIQKHPTPAHLWIKELVDSKKASGVISQNIDGLDEKSGLNSLEELVLLHGTLDWWRCDNHPECGLRFRKEDAHTERLKDRAHKKILPPCPNCEVAPLEHDLVLYGQKVENEDFKRAKRSMNSCDMVIILGTTLEIQHVRYLLQKAQENFFKKKRGMMVVVNKGRPDVDYGKDNEFKFLINIHFEGDIQKFAGYMKELGTRSKPSET